MKLVDKLYRFLLRKVYYIIRDFNIFIVKKNYERSQRKMSIKLTNLGDKDIEKLSKRYAKFIDSMPANYKVFIGSLDFNRKVEEVALAEALNYSYIQEKFTKGEIQALQYFYFRGMNEDDVSKRFLLNFYALRETFKKLCGELRK